MLMSAANVFNLGANIGAMGACLQLLIPGKTIVFTTIFGLASLLAVLFIPYSTFGKYLKWLTLSLFAYVGVAFTVHLPWKTVVRSPLIPRMHFARPFRMVLIAVL